MEEFLASFPYFARNWIIKSGTDCPIRSRPGLLGERIIVLIRWRLGNLKKTYLGDPQQPLAAKIWLPMFEWVGQTLTCSNIGIIAMAIAMADV